MYRKIVLPPILDNLEMSFKSDTPFINEAKIKGTAINLRALINIFHFLVDEFIILLFCLIKDGRQ